MAKGGRRLTTSRSERYLGSYEFNPSQQTVNGGGSEFGEDEVWSTVHGDEEPVSGGSSYSSRGEWTARASYYGENNGATFPPEPYDSAPRHRRPPRRSSDHRQVGGLSLAFDGSASNAGGSTVSPHGRVTSMATSAPVNVPDWSRIYHVNSVESLNDVAEDVDGDESSSEIVPPHEYLARSRRTSTSSVFEGAGRTLKGRDLSRVRDAVWSQTGFYG